MLLESSGAGTVSGSDVHSQHAQHGRAPWRAPPRDGGLEAKQAVMNPYPPNSAGAGSSEGASTSPTMSSSAAAGASSAKRARKKTSSNSNQSPTSEVAHHDYERKLIGGWDAPCRKQRRRDASAAVSGRADVPPAPRADSDATVRTPLLRTQRTTLAIRTTSRTRMCRTRCHRRMADTRTRILRTGMGPIRRARLSLPRRRRPTLRRAASRRRRLACRSPAEGQAGQGGRPNGRRIHVLCPRRSCSRVRMDMEGVIYLPPYGEPGDAGGWYGRYGRAIAGER